jgi:hypothetical protein
MKDYGCKAVAPTMLHEHTCDQPRQHPLGLEHHCPICEHWWQIDPAGLPVDACLECQGVAR